MKRKIGPLEVTFEDVKVTLIEDLALQARVITQYMIYGAGAALVLLTVLGNLAFGIFIAVFIGGCVWFIRNHGISTHKIVIDKTAGQLRVFRGSGKNVPEATHHLSNFTQLRLAYRHHTDAAGNPREVPDYHLLLARNVDDAQADAALPTHLAGELGKSDLGDTLLRHVARGAETGLERLTATQIVREAEIRQLAQDIREFLAPEYPVEIDEVFMPALFQRR